MNTPASSQPTHDEIAAKAHALWEQRGHPTGSDNEIWLEAERLLKAEAPAAPSATAKPTEKTATPAVASFPKPTPAAAPTAQTNTTIKAPAAGAPAAAPSVPPAREAELATAQKEAARAAQVPHHTGPKQKPAETGKPVWPKPHSS